MTFSGEVLLGSGSEGQDAPHERVHHVCRGRLHDDVAHEVLGQRVKFPQQRAEGLELPLVGEFSREEQICRLLEAEALVAQGAAHEGVDVVAAVVEFPFDGDALAVLLLHGADLGDLRQPRHDAAPVQVAQPLLDVVLRIVFGIDAAGVRTLAGEIADLHPFILGEKAVLAFIDSHIHCLLCHADRAHDCFHLTIF